MNIEPFVTWQQEKREGGPLRFWDAVWSLFSNTGEFFQMLEAVVPELSRQGLSADAALAEALVRIFRELIPTRNLMLRYVLRRLTEAGVPEAELVPERLSQDWGQSRLCDGHLTLCLTIGTRRVAEANASCSYEQLLFVVFPSKNDAPYLRVLTRVVG